MNEQEFIYGKLKNLTEEVEFLFDTVNRQQDMIEELTKIITMMQSPDYASKQAKTAQMVDVAEKLAFIKNLNNKK